jgi:hypothetical protein
VSLAAATEFAGDVFVADTKKITLTSTAAVITLKQNAELAQGAAAAIPAVYSGILANFESSDVTLTPALAGTTLTFGGTNTKSLTQSGPTGHGIEIGGKATLIPDATYTVGDRTASVGGSLTLDDGAELIIGKGILATLKGNNAVGGGIDNADTSAKLVLDYIGDGDTNANALGTGTGAKITAGATTISGAWTTYGLTLGQGVIAGNIAIEQDAITAGVGLKLAGGTGAAIGVTTAAGASEAAKLTVNGVVDLGTAGTVTLTGNGTAGAAILLKGGANAGSLIVDSANLTNAVDVGSDVSVTNFLVMPSGGSDDTNAKVTKDGSTKVGTIVVTGAAAGGDASGGTALGKIGGGGTADDHDAQITGPTDASKASVITKGSLVKVPKTA